MRFLFALSAAMILPCCWQDTRPTRDRGGSSVVGGAPEYPEVEKDRCLALGKSALRQQCDDAKYIAQTYVRGLAAGDQVCLEGGFGQSPGGACLARASVADAATGKVLIEIRDVKPTSRWFDHAQSQVWFPESTLVDLYLAERGY
jgi:hypothetical protein